MLLPYSKRVVPQLWDTLNGISLPKRQARVELNLFDYSDSKRYYSQPDVVEHDEGSKQQYDLSLGFKNHERVRYCCIFYNQNNNH
jgi:hypothetical protein